MKGFYCARGHRATPQKLGKLLRHYGCCRWNIDRINVREHHIDCRIATATQSR